MYMNYATLLKMFTPKVLRPVGRWRLETCPNLMKQKIDLSNEDHCGPCGQYIKKIENKKTHSI
jgi:hypothetical protein